MGYADIHNHALWGVDDGAKTEEEMRQMVVVAYQDGCRTLFLTPHFHLGYFGDNQQKSAQCFQQLQDWAGEQFPDLQLVLGNELRYSQGCIDWLEESKCRPMGQTNFLLVDFSEHEKATVIEKGLSRLFNAGYTPILAHAERYVDLHHRRDVIERLRANGVYIQMDARSVLGDFGFWVKQAAKGLLVRRLVDFVGSDAHDLKRRPPGLAEAYQFIEKKYGNQYAAKVCGENARRILLSQKERVFNDE